MAEMMSAEKCPFGLVTMSHLNFFVCGPKFTIFLSPKVEGIVVDEVFFQMFDMSISSGDIRDQIRKLSEIAPKFGRYLALPNFGGGLPKVVRSLSTLPQAQGTSSGEVSLRYSHQARSY